MTSEHAHGRPDVEHTPEPLDDDTGRTAERPAEVTDIGTETGAGEHAKDDDLTGLTADELRAKVREARAEAQRNWQQFLHSAADLENYKKLAARDRQDAVDRTRRQVLGVALGVLDTLERALTYATGQDAESKALRDGLQMAHRQMLDQLAVMGVRPIDAVGRRFDPRLHEAVAAVPPEGASQAPGMVAAEVLRGYRLNDDVLRPARVTVVSDIQGDGKGRTAG